MTRELIKLHLERLLDSRVSPKTICPSEVPRAFSTSELEDIGVTNWRDLMPQVRSVLWEMRDRGEVEILQKGVPLPSTTSLDQVTGPIRARRKTQGIS